MPRALDRMPRRVLCFMAAVTLAWSAGCLAIPAATATTFTPWQFIAKLYTEGLGRAPDPSGWNTYSAVFASQGCNASSVGQVANAVLTSPEFTGLGYANPQLVEVAYRALLNREPDSSGYANWLSQLNSGTSWAAVLNGIETTGSEFAADVSTICGTADYGFSGQPPVELDPVPAGDTGFSQASSGCSQSLGGSPGGCEYELQQLLDSAGSGTTVHLAQGALVMLAQTLVIPAGVTLSTTGSPGPGHYAAMGRLARAPGWGDPNAEAPSVTVDGGALLISVWVDGDREGEPSYSRWRYNVSVLGGTGTTIENDRLGNPSGATDLEFLGAGNNHPCSGAVIAGNLVEAYSSQHGGVLWSDGISDGCEGSSVHDNQVVDASDTSIILFGSLVATQVSQVYHNTVVQAGHGAFALLAADPSTVPGEGTGGETSSFAGADIHDNTIWTSPVAVSTFGITDGTYAWFPASGTHGRAIGDGAVITGNSSTSDGITEPVYAETGIAVSGMLDTTVTGNSLNYVQSTDPNSTCPQYPIGESISAHWASGTFQTVQDATYSPCVLGKAAA